MFSGGGSAEVLGRICGTPAGRTWSQRNFSKKSRRTPPGEGGSPVPPEAPGPPAKHQGPWAPPPAIAIAITFPQHPQCIMDMLILPMVLIMFGGGPKLQKIMEIIELNLKSRNVNIFTFPMVLIVFGRVPPGIQKC